MGREADKHVRVTDETWKRLNMRKEPGDSFDDVITRLLDQDEEEGDKGNSSSPAVADD